MLGLSRLLILQFLNEQVICNRHILLDETSLIGHLDHEILRISDVIITCLLFEKYGIGCSMFLFSVMTVLN